METQINPAPAQAAPTNDNAEFKKKIEESKVVIAEAAQAPKRGRGRPPKPRPELSAQNTPNQAEPMQAAVPAPNISAYIKQPLIVISKIPAVNYQIPELQLSDDEASACAESLNQVVQAFVPNVNNMDPKTAAVVSAFAVFGSVGFQKYSIFKEKQKTLPKKEEKELQEEVKKAQETSGVGADDYFTRQAI